MAFTYEYILTRPYYSEHKGSDEILVVTDFFNIEYPRVGANSNKISSDGAFVTRDVRSIVLGTVFHPRCERTNTNSH